MSAEDSMDNKLRYAIMTEYDGQAFSGWQRQKTMPSVQACLEDAWETLTGEKTRLTGGSRTDAGVSARAHVASFLTSSPIPADRMALAWNTALPAPLVVRAVRPVGLAFNPRYDALGKRYRYCLATGPVRPAIDRDRAAHVPAKLDLDAMRQAALRLTGTHDFTAFMDQGSPTRRPVRTLHRLDIVQEEDRIFLFFTGDGFLYHMVRILTGTLVGVGQGKIDPDKVRSIMENQDRRQAGPTMPAQGLVLDQVYFAGELFGGDCWPYPDPRRASKLPHLTADNKGPKSLL